MLAVVRWIQKFRSAAELEAPPVVDQWYPNNPITADIVRILPISSDKRVIFFAFVLLFVCRYGIVEFNVPLETV